LGWDSIKAACGTASIGMRLDYADLQFLGLARTARTRTGAAAGSPAWRLFPLGVIASRQSLAAIHRQVVNRLLNSCATRVHSTISILDLTK